MAQNNLVRWFKKGLLFSVITIVIGILLQVLGLIGIGSGVLEFRSLQELGIFLILIMIGMTIFEGYLIEKINVWVKK